MKGRRARRGWRRPQGAGTELQKRDAAGIEAYCIRCGDELAKQAKDPLFINTKYIQESDIAMATPTAAEKAKYSLYSALVFLLIASPFMYRATSSVLGGWIASKQGLPTVAGLLLHTVVFALILFGLMYLPLP